MKRNVMSDSLINKENIGDSKSVVTWAVLLFIITLVSALPLIIGNLNLENLPEASPILPLVFTGIILTAYTPSLAALLVARFWHGKAGLRALLSQLATWRVGIVWYLLVLLGPMLLVLVANIISILLGGAPPRQWMVLPSTLAFLGPLFAGSLGEELGWRGFSLPRLQNRYGPLWASIIIGVIWSTWHLWPAITPGGLVYLTLANLAQTFMRLIATSILYAWLYNSTNGSLFLVMVAHAGHNIAIELIPIPEQSIEVVPVIIALLYLAAAITVVLMTRTQTISRSPQENQ
jgi:uncharacterized protein